VSEAFRFVVTPLAELDVADAASWYEGRVTGLGVRFVESVDASLDSVSANPHQYPIVHRDIRRTLLRGFPYALFYVLRDDVVRVIACMHTRRRPKRWQSRR
jgi:toxin ParE1/3/4